MSAVVLARHVLAYPHRGAHGKLIAQVTQACLAPCVREWLDNGWPLVVARQVAKDESRVDLGIALAPALGRHRLAFRIDRDAIVALRAPWGLAQVAQAAPDDWRAGLDDLERCLARERLDVQVFGSFAWQAITGRPYVTPASDLDLACPMHRRGEPEACEAILGDWEARHGRRADLELVFPSGRAVPWREWRDVRANSSRTTQVLAKSLRDVALVPATRLDLELAGHPQSGRCAA